MTAPNGRSPSSEAGLPSRFAYGNDVLATDLWPDGTVTFRPGGAGFVLEDGALQMKFLWFKVKRPMTVTGRRLDGAAPPLRAAINRQFDTQDFQPSYLIFPTPGCWEVTGRVGDASLTFVTRVVKSGAGPSNRM